MSSTDLTLDAQEIHFILKDWLNLSRLTEYECFKDFDEETVEMLLEEEMHKTKDAVLD